MLQLIHTFYTRTKKLILPPKLFVICGYVLEFFGNEDIMTSRKATSNKTGV